MRARPDLFDALPSDHLGLSFGVTAESRLGLLRLSLKHVVPYLERADVLELGQVREQGEPTLIIYGLVDCLIVDLGVCFALVLLNESTEAC